MPLREWQLYIPHNFLMQPLGIFLLYSLTLLSTISFHIRKRPLRRREEGQRRNEHPSTGNGIRKKRGKSMGDRQRGFSDSTSASLLRKVAAMGLAKCLQEDLTCSVCMEYFTEPVTISCGHSFCRFCLLRCSDAIQKSFSCPECRGACHLKDLETGKRLGRLAVIGMQLGPHLPRGPAEEEELCEKHQQSLKLFCQEDDTVICVPRYRSKEHGEHSVSPTGEAAEDYRERFQELLHPLWAEIEEVQTVLAAEKMNSAMVKEEVQKCRQNLVSEFQKMHLFLDEELELRLRILKKDKGENLQKPRKGEEHLFQRSHALRALITELEEKCQSGSIELLRVKVQEPDMRSVSELQQWPKANRSFELTTCCVPGMREILSRYAVDMTLDPNTAGPHLVVSQDRRSVTLVEAPQDVPDHQDRFDNCGSVLGIPVFTSGRHYWEVEVGDQPEWEVVVCYE
ncbi:probable E3 ubiquitin-protein ligase TRIML1 [Tachyglossus aculeatus]|uniref:probable E3 ubiquitin-protein ligase TRIML1 n=1 Tax=Tachyglossus aculeatus TaxID=9261 RepID=UPI0018F5B562|nr:probable E3 ubiquitin-protein ligase TRIML1 [Tachyglossus aculeatus]